MSLPRYSVLKADPIKGEIFSNNPKNPPHFHVTAQIGRKQFDIAINIQSEDASQVLYVVDHAFTPPDPKDLTALDMGLHALESIPGGLALDYVRSTVNGASMVTKAGMRLLPLIHDAQHRNNDLRNEVVDLLDRSIEDEDAVVYAFGDAFPRHDGIHDIHMNQGNPKQGGHSKDNGIFQDGGVLFQFPGQDRWVAVFIAFQTESWRTDDRGNPVGQARRARRRR